MSKTVVGMFECAYFGERGKASERGERECTIGNRFMFCQQHNTDAFNECDSSGLISWTLCIKGESHCWIRGSAQ